MKKELQKENAMAKHPKKENASATKKPKQAKAKGTHIRFLKTPMHLGLGYHPGEEVKNFDTKKAEELIESGYAEKL